MAGDQCLRGAAQLAITLAVDARGIFPQSMNLWAKQNQQKIISV